MALKYIVDIPKSNICLFIFTILSHVYIYLFPSVFAFLSATLVATLGSCWQHD